MPDWRSEIERRLRGARLDAASERELIEELAQDLEDRYREILAGGAEEGEARDAALGGLGEIDTTRWHGRPRHSEPSLAGNASSGNIVLDFLRDLRYGWRVIRRTPALTFFAALSLALGIGANTTVFTIINTLLLHPITAADPARLVMVYESGGKDTRQASAHLPLSYPNFQDYARSQNCFVEMAAFTPPELLTLGGQAAQQNFFGEFVTARYFDALGIAPALGRFVLPQEDTTPGSAPVAVISYAAWKTRFGGASGVIGRTLELNRVAFTVVGVAPKNFLGLSPIFGPDVWLPATMAENGAVRGALSDRGKPLFRAFGRLKPGFTLQRAQAAFEPVAVALEREYHDSDRGRRIVVRPLSDELFSNAGGSGGLAFGSAVLLAIVMLVLGIACSNVANLLLARALARRSEIAVRLAMGAERTRLVRQMLTESLLLSLMSCPCGIALGYAGCRFVWSFVPANVAANMTTPRMDVTVLLFALAVSLLTALFFGLAPALRASRTDVAAGLKEESRSAGRTRRMVSLGNGLLVAQVAFSMVCLLTSALFFRSIQRAYTIDPGFQTNHLAIFLVDPHQAGYDQTRSKEFYREARERVSALPGVAFDSWASGPPFWHSASRTIEVEGVEQRNRADAIATVDFTVDTDYFATMGIELLRGRTFAETDRDITVPVAVVNDTLAERYWPRGDALGHRFHFAGDPVWRQVVGIVKTANYTTLGEAPQPCVYVPLRQNFSNGMYLYVRSQGEPQKLLAEVQREIRSMDANLQIGDVRTGANLIQNVLWGAIVGVSLLGIFGSLALVLASVGLYGVMAYSVTRRRREIGLRVALGASPAAVVRLILRDGMALVVCGVAIGLGAGLLAGRLLSRMLFGIGPSDPVSLAASAAVLLAVAWIACYLPARAAIRIDPLTALRDL